MKKYIFTVLVISLFIFTGCKNTVSPSDQQNTKLKKSEKQVTKKITNKSEQKTEDEIAQKEFERLISEPPKYKVNTKKITIEGAAPEDIEILDVTNSDLNSIN